MTPEISTDLSSTFSAWKIGSNPIFRRYCRSRLRPRGLGISVLIVVLISGFFFAMLRTLAKYQGHFNPADSERAPLIAIFVIQALILFVLGTAQTAGGMTSERDEGVIDYQRLIPMSPLSKALGYLFGLPVREYVMFLSTLPFTIWSLWRGEVELKNWLPLYAILFSSAILYHLTGLVTGTVVKNRRWAFLTSIGLVICLYTVIPQMAKFGLVFFKYLTVTPVFIECYAGLVPRSIGKVIDIQHQFAPTVKFFGLQFSEAVFTVFSQGGLALTFIAMLCRKWKKDESHLLGKSWTTLFFIWIQILLLGNALPMIDPGDLFPTRGIAGYVRLTDWSPSGGEAIAMSGAYGLVTLLILFIFTGLITPSLDNQMRGWRRARKQGETSLPFFSDSASGSIFVLIMALAAAAGWSIFTRGLVESRWFPGHHLTSAVYGCFFAVMLITSLGYHALLELKGGRFVGLSTILIGFVPLMISAVFGATDQRFIPAASWVAGLSPASLPIYASGSLLSLAELPEMLARSVPRAFQFWLLAFGVTTAWLMIRLRAARKAMAKSVLSRTEENP